MRLYYATWNSSRQDYKKCSDNLTENITLVANNVFGYSFSSSCAINKETVCGRNCFIRILVFVLGRLGGFSLHCSCFQAAVPDWEPECCSWTLLEKLPHSLLVTVFYPQTTFVFCCHICSSCDNHNFTVFLSFCASSWCCCQMRLSRLSQPTSSEIFEISNFICKAQIPKFQLVSQG